MHVCSTTIHIHTCLLLCYTCILYYFIHSSYMYCICTYTGSTGKAFNAGGKAIADFIASTGILCYYIMCYTMCMNNISLYYVSAYYAIMCMHSVLVYVCILYYYVYTIHEYIISLLL